MAAENIAFILNLVLTKILEHTSFFKCSIRELFYEPEINRLVKSVLSVAL